MPLLPVPSRFLIHRLMGLAFVLLGTTNAVATELPDAYFTLMAEHVSRLEAETPRQENLGAMLAAAVLYTKQHPANPAYHDKKKLDVALKLGDWAADYCDHEAANEYRRDLLWEIHFWLDSYRILEGELGADRRAHWRRGIEKIAGWFARDVEECIDVPRFQSGFVSTSINLLSIRASTVYLAGRILPNKEWENLGMRALHRIAAEEQTPDGFWGEQTDNGPATGYNYVTLCSVALYWEHSHDTAALEALRRATDFHKYFTWPDGTPVETINGRNRLRAVSPFGHFGFSHWPDGRRYAAFLTQSFVGRQLGSRDLGRLSQNALYFHEGPTSAIPQDLPRSSYRMRLPAGIRKTGAWTVCLSGLIDAPSASRFTLDRQGNLSIYHEKAGLIVTGGNSKYQPELATFLEKSKDRVVTMPLNSRLRMDDQGDRLGLGFPSFFAEAEVKPASADRLPFRFSIVDRALDPLRGSQLQLQLCLKAGEVLETAQTKVTLDEKRIELEPEQIGGWIRHHGWTLHVDPTAKLTWPVFPFNPYRNAPETQTRHAVGMLTVSLKAQPPMQAASKWRRQEIAFVLESK